ncbi:WxL domain-containing protein [Enterococcus faecium]|nr:WxL domain-containing protein [Enterococcus faecium]MDQ8481287.1 WxL domain-containing protein [Enterococcus faecium]
MKKHVTLFSSVLMMSTTLLGAGGVFADVVSVEPSPNTQNTPVTATLTIDTATVPTLPDDGTSGGHTNDNATSSFGIAYHPTSLSGNKQLKSEGQDTVDLSNNSADKLHVGVKDLTRQKHGWTLKASLSWNGDTNNYMEGTSIDLSGGKVQKNVEGSLTPLDNEEVTGKSSVSINGTASEVMKSDSQKTINGVYDYEFTDVTLNIPEAKNVPAGTYDGNINWSLENTPA